MNKLLSREGWQRQLADWLDPANAVLFLAVLIALGLLFSYSQTNRSLAKENYTLNVKLAEVTNPQLGDVVPTLMAKDLQGNQVTIRYEGPAPHLLLIFSTTCVACELQIAEWNRLAAEMKAKKISVQAISLDSAEETANFFKNHAREFDVLIPLNQPMERSYRANTVPQTMLVSEHGIISWLRLGRTQEGDSSSLQTKIQ